MVNEGVVFLAYMAVLPLVLDSSETAIEQIAKRQAIGLILIILVTSFVLYGSLKELCAGYASLKDKYVTFRDKADNWDQRRT